MPDGHCPAQPLLQQPGSLHRATNRTGRSTDPPGTFHGSSSQDQKSPPLLPAPHLSSTKDMWFPNTHLSGFHEPLPVPGQPSGPTRCSSPTPPLSSAALGTPQQPCLVLLVFVSSPQTRGMSCWELGWSAYQSPSSFAIFFILGPWGAGGEVLPPTLECVDLVAHQVPGLVDVAEKLVVVGLWVREEWSSSPAPRTPPQPSPLPALRYGASEVARHDFAISTHC